MKLLFGIFTLILMSLADASFAHSGGLNAAGCHNNRKTGGYHCHRAQPRQPSLQRFSTPVATPSRESIQTAQNLLLAMGYDCGAPDGSIGTKTKAAIIAFELDRSLTRTGRVSTSLIAELASATRLGWQRPAN